MSRCHCNTQHCLTFQDEVAKAGVRYLGQAASSPLFFQVATPLCKKKKICCLRVTVAQLETTGILPTITFTLVRTLRNQCCAIIGPLRTQLTVSVTGNGSAEFCHPLQLCPGESVAILVEPSNLALTFLATAEAC